MARPKYCPSSPEDRPPTRARAHAHRDVYTDTDTHTNTRRQTWTHRHTQTHALAQTHTDILSVLLLT